MTSTSSFLLRTLEQNIVKQYPDSFADVLADGTKIGSGYASLLLRVKTCDEHVTRNSTLARRRKERLRSSCRTISQSSRRPADQYGFVSWQPEELPTLLKRSARKWYCLAYWMSGAYVWNVCYSVKGGLLWSCAHFKERTKSLLIEADVSNIILIYNFLMIEL